jgi:hypothetical protein
VLVPELLHAGHSVIVLDLKECFPHISLYGANPVSFDKIFDELGFCAVRGVQVDMMGVLDA